MIKALSRHQNICSVMMKQSSCWFRSETGTVLLCAMSCDSSRDMKAEEAVRDSCLPLWLNNASAAVKQDECGTGTAACICTTRPNHDHTHPECDRVEGAWVTADPDRDEDRVCWAARLQLGPIMGPWGWGCCRGWVWGWRSEG